LAVITVTACDTPAADSPYCEAWRHNGGEAQLWLVDAEIPAEDAMPVPLRLNLPLPEGLVAEVAQGTDGPFTHQGAQRFAWDFDVPVGTPVIAAASGVVVSAVSGYDDWGPEPSWRDGANRVVIDHGAGLFSAYVHLGEDQVYVARGDRVEAGQTLGTTGLSGQMTGPHLHFHVENAWSDTLPARFFSPTTLTCELFPLGGDLVTGALSEPFDDHGPSQAPPEIFTDFGISDLTGAPARLFSTRRKYTVAGAVTAGFTDAVFLLLPEGGGRAVFARRWPVGPDGHFRGTLDLKDVPPGEYGWAVVASSDESATVARSVRCVVVR